MFLTPDYITQREALARLRVSRTLFESRFRPQLTEYRFGERAVRYDGLELMQIAAEAVAPQEERQGPAMFARRTVKDALEHAWRVKWKDSKGALKKSQLKKVVEDELGDVRLDHLNYNRLEEWVLELRDRDLAIATIKSRLSCLQFALRLAVQKGWIKSVPPAPEIGTANRKLRYLLDEPDEEAMLLSACERSQRYVVSDVMRRVIVVLLDTGARLGELLKARDDSVSTRGVTFLDRKAGDNLTVPLTARARDAFEYLQKSRYWQKRIRGTRDDPKRLQSAQHWVTHRFIEIRNEAGLRDVTVHTLRHTCASRLIQAGVSIYVVRQWLGHSSIRTTERYAHLAPSSMTAGVNALQNRGTPLDEKVVPINRGRDDGP
jgi:integrase